MPDGRPSTSRIPADRNFAGRSAKGSRRRTTGVSESPASPEPPEAFESPETSEPPGSRCGYTHEASTLSDLGGICCWRPVWDHADRCIWHADEERKPTAALEAAAPTAGNRLDGAVFRDVSLRGAGWLAGRVLTDARFVDCSLVDAVLDDADLRGARFEGTDARRGRFRRANLESAEFHQSDLRSATLTDARLRYAVFANARIDERTEFGDRLVYEDELTGSRDADERLDRFESARWTYRELQRLAEDNGLRDAAREYYLREKDLRRRLAWESGSYLRAVAEEVWRWTTGYGSNPRRVVATSAAVIVGCALLYPLTGGIQETAGGATITYAVEDPATAPERFLLLVFFKSLYFSTVTFATLGYGDIQPVGTVARAVAGTEALLGQLLLALFVFVLTRTVTWSE